MNDVGIIDVICYVFAFSYATSAIVVFAGALLARSRFSSEMSGVWGSVSILALLSYGLFMLGGADPANGLLTTFLSFAFVCASFSYYICARHPEFVVE